MALEIRGDLPLHIYSAPKICQVHILGHEDNALKKMDKVAGK